MNRCFCYPRAASACLASLILAPRFGGLAVFDRFGLALRPGVKERAAEPLAPSSLVFQALSFRAAKTPEHRRRAVRRTVLRIARGYRPQMLVVGRIGREGPVHAELRLLAHEVAREIRLPIREVSLQQIRRDWCGESRENLRAFLARIVDAFHPLLKPELTERMNAKRYRHHAWQALAAGTDAFLSAHPSAALAALTPGKKLPAPVERRLLTHLLASLPTPYVPTP